MRGTVMYGPGAARVETVPDPQIVEPTHALVRVTRACICGSDLWPYQQMESSRTGRRMGHEFIGIVEDAGAEVRTVKKGDLVVAPFCVVGRHLRVLAGSAFRRPACTEGSGVAPVNPPARRFRE